jgi:hypothetical protein
MKPASAKLVEAAKAAARAHAKAAEANRAWVDAFRAEYGHEDISDALVECIDYASGNGDVLTGAFIAENSSPGQS